MLTISIRICVCVWGGSSKWNFYLKFQTIVNLNLLSHLTINKKKIWLSKNKSARNAQLIPREVCLKNKKGEENRGYYIYVTASSAGERTTTATNQFDKASREHTFC